MKLSDVGVMYVPGLTINLFSFILGQTQLFEVLLQSDDVLIRSEHRFGRGNFRVHGIHSHASRSQVVL